MLDFSTMKEWQIPGIIILLVDVQGIIRDVSREPEHFLIFTRNEIIGRRLNKVLRPITQATEPFMNPCAVPYKGFVPDELYVQVRHPSIASSDFSLFLYSFTPAFFKGKHRCALVFLARQTNNAPLTKKFMAIYRSENIPIIILDNEFRLVSCNLQFQEILNFTDIRTFRRKPIFPLLTKECRSPNPFLNEKRTRLIRTMACRQGQAWKKYFDLFSKGIPATPEAAGFCVHAGAVFSKKEKGIIIGRSPERTEQWAVLTTEFSTNTTIQDFEINLKIDCAKKCSFTLVLGHPLVNKSLRFENGYYLDVDINSATLFTFIRRGTVLFSRRVRASAPNLTITRIGGYFELSLDGKTLFSYADPYPIFARSPSNFSLIIWNGEMGLTRFTIRTRPTVFNIDDIEAADKPVVSFAAAPEKLYHFTTELISYLGSKSAIAVRFHAIKTFSLPKKKDSYLRLFETTRQYIEDNFYRKIDFAILARQCCVSQKYFIKLFKEYFGLSPKAYQTDLRIKEARNLLKSGIMEIQQVGETVGLYDPVNFQHIFKKYTGRTPGSYRTSR